MKIIINLSGMDFEDMIELTNEVQNVVDSYAEATMEEQ